MRAGIRIERLRQQDRSGFSCGVPALDRYLRDIAGQDIRRGVANCFLALDDNDRTILGFYTLAAASIPLSGIPEAMRKKLPPYPQLPATLIGRLAVDTRHARGGVGSAMIFDAAKRSIEADPAVYALVVDAKDETAARFYRQIDFLPLDRAPMWFFLPLATLRRALAP